MNKNILKECKRLKVEIEKRMQENRNTEQDFDTESILRFAILYCIDLINEIEE